MALRFRLASFNLENFGGGDAGGRDPRAAARLEARLAVLRPQLDRLGADILCLQEVQGERRGRSGPRRLGGLDPLLAGTRYEAMERICPKVRDVHNLVTVSGFAPIEAREVRHERVEPPRHRRPRFPAMPGAAAQPVRFDRPVLYTLLELAPDRRLHLFNLHLRAPLAAFIEGEKLGPFAWRTTAGWAEGYYLAGLKRAAQALEVRLLIDAILDEEAGALIAVAGDLNAEDHETPVRLLAAESADTGNGLLAARSLVPLERSLPVDARVSAIHHGRRLMLDHILVSRTLLAGFRGLEVHAETLDDELAPSMRTDEASESYHAPLVAEFEFG